MIFKLPETKQITFVSRVMGWLPEEINIDLTVQGPHISLLDKKWSRNKDCADDPMLPRAIATILSSMRKASTTQVAALTGPPGR